MTTSIHDDRLRAARALAAEARRQVDELERALSIEPRRHDPIIAAGLRTRESADAAIRFYSAWLNDRPVSA